MIGDLRWNEKMEVIVGFHCVLPNLQFRLKSAGFVNLAGAMRDLIGFVSSFGMSRRLRLFSALFLCLDLESVGEELVYVRASNFAEYGP